MCRGQRTRAPGLGSTPRTGKRWVGAQCARVRVGIWGRGWNSGRGREEERQQVSPRAVPPSGEARRGRLWKGAPGRGDTGKDWDGRGC